MKDIVIYNKDTYDVIAIIPEVEEKERDIILNNKYDVEYIKPNSKVFKGDEKDSSIKLYKKGNIIYFAKYKKLINGI